MNCDRELEHPGSVGFTQRCRGRGAEGAGLEKQKDLRRTAGVISAHLHPRLLSFVLFHQALRILSIRLIIRVRLLRGL